MSSEQLVIQSAKGYALANTWVRQSAVDGMQKVLSVVGGGNVEVLKTGLRLTGRLNKDQAVESLSYLSHLNDKESEVRTAIALAMGDLILDLEVEYGETEVEDLVAQLSNELGQHKHMVMEYKRTCKWLREIYPNLEARPDNLSITHWIELKNGARRRNGTKAIPDEVVMEIIQEVSHGNLINAGVTDSDGNPVEQRSALSCKMAREMLKEARISAGEPVKPPKIKFRRYLYIDTDVNEVINTDVNSDQYFHFKIDLKDFTCTNLPDGVTLGIEQTNEER